MSAFTFHPDLFEHRNDALAALDEAGYQWMTDFSTIDVLHDLYGLEVCGIKDEDDAQRILELLQQTFRWSHGHTYLKEWGSRDPGWKVVVHRDPRGGQGGPRAGSG